MSKNYNPMSQVDYMGRDMNALIDDSPVVEKADFGKIDNSLRTLQLQKDADTRPCNKYNTATA